MDAASHPVNDSEVSERHRPPATALTVIMALHHRSVEPQTRQACYGRGQPVNDSDVIERYRQPTTALTVMMALHPHLINPNPRITIFRGRLRAAHEEPEPVAAEPLDQRAADRLLHLPAAAAGKQHRARHHLEPQRRLTGNLKAHHRSHLLVLGCQALSHSVPSRQALSSRDLRCRFPLPTAAQARRR